jgi:protein gp37
MSDLFHEKVPLDFIQKVFDVMYSTPRHTYQILTKRPERLVELAPHLEFHENIWLGVSVENQSYVSRIDLLRQVPANVRFLSCEPLLGSLNLDLTNIDWVIVGGESGEKHRPINLDWVRDIRDQCQKAEVAFFFKQVGGRTSKSGGNLLDGKEYLEFPKESITSLFKKGFDDATA